MSPLWGWLVKGLWGPPGLGIEKPCGIEVVVGGAEAGLEYAEAKRLWGPTTPL
jgi:hypothetical protein